MLLKVNTFTTNNNNTGLGVGKAPPPVQHQQQQSLTISSSQNGKEMNQDLCNVPGALMFHFFSAVLVTF